MTSGGDSACSLNVGIPLLDRAEQILVPRERQIGIVAALQQQLDAADGDRLVDLSEQLVESEHVAFGRSDGPIERAEVALRDADVRVVDVAVDDVGDDAFGMLARADRRRPAGRAAASARGDRARALRRPIDAPAAREPSPQSLDRHAHCDAEEPQRLPAPRTHRRRDCRADLRGVAVEQLEAGAFVGAKIVLDIIAQVPRAEVALLGGIAESTRRAIASGCAGARVPRLLQRATSSAPSAPGTPRPERPDERQTGHRRSTPRRDRSSRDRACSSPDSAINSALSPMISAASPSVEHRAQIGPDARRWPARSRTAARTSTRTSATDVRELVSIAIDRTSRHRPRRKERHRRDRPARCDRQVRHDPVGRRRADIRSTESVRGRCRPRGAAGRIPTARRIAGRTAAIDRDRRPAGGH